LTGRQKKILSFFIKAAIVVIAFWFIYRKFVANENLHNFKTLLKDIPHSEIMLVVGTVLAMMLVNWFLEAAKWKRLIRDVEKISFYRAIESVFCGLTLAVFTPNRLGEYGGRVFFLSPKRRIVGVVVMAVGNIGQMVLTNFFGAIAIYAFAYRFLNFNAWIIYPLGLVIVAYCIFFLVFFFNIKWLNRLLLSIKFMRKYERFYSILARYSKQELFKILMFCLARYVVFTSQYLVLFLWLIPGLSPVDIVMMICIMFFIQSALPSLDLFEVGVRSLTASYFFSFVTHQDVAVIACTATIWFVNIIIPAILGTYFVFKLNFFGNPKTH